MKRANVYFRNTLAGILTEDETGYTFMYTPAYLSLHEAQPISLTFPLQDTPFHDDKVLFPFFDGLIPEGWLLDIAEHNWKLNRNNRMGLLLTCCNDCIGAVSIKPIKEEDE